jgi:UTP--glucose-1-phosphate uridylyltransferase
LKVRKAVIPAAGLGTRFLPATKAQPKEMIPVVDRPGIQYTIEEAARAGISDVLIVTSRGKSSMEDHFDRAPELEAYLQQSGKKDELAEVVRIAEIAEVHAVRQQQPLGFGHSVLMAREHVGSEPFVVMVPDEIVPEPSPGEEPLLERMIEIFAETSSSVIAVVEVPEDEISSYGCIKPDFVSDDVARIVDIIEKPAKEDAPSNLGARGRYVFTAEIFDAIERTDPGVGNEIQLTDAIKLLGDAQDVYAYVHRGPIYDVGKKLDYLKASVELALRREDLAQSFKEFLVEVVKSFE